MKNNHRASIFLIMLFLMLWMAACAPQPTVAPTLVPTVEPPTSTPVMPEPTSPTSAPPTPTAEPVAPSETAGVPALPAEPQVIEFQAADGQALNGRYYPAAGNPAPLVVLMHWAPGDQNDWTAIAYWLQNRGLSAPAGGGPPWLDSSWFPPMIEGQSFAVFTFTFRNCEGGCQGFERAAWLQDARAAMEKAYTLEGVDLTRIVAIGASIGADGAPDGCTWLNGMYVNSCLGALSLSPGGFLTLPYREAVTALGAEQPPKPGWCLYAKSDSDSRRACENAEGENYLAYEYEGDMHGMVLIQPGLEPGALDLILEFLKLTFGL